MARFKKGQTVFYANTNFADTDDRKRVGVVIARTVDACGAKQITFADFGDDLIYGRRVHARSVNLFETCEEAFEFLLASTLIRGYATEVYSDRSSKPFDDFRAGTMPIVWQ